MMICQTPSNEVFARVRNRWFVRELHLAGIEDGLVTDDCHLRLVVAEGLHPEQQLVEDDSDGPNVNLLGDLWIFALVETLRRLVPIRADTLTCELDLILVLLDDLAETEVGNFHLSIMKDNILWFKIVVDYLLLLVG